MNFTLDLKEIRELINWRLVSIIFLLYFLIIVMAIFNFSTNNYQHFSIQSESFLEGRLDLIKLDKQGGELDVVKTEDGLYYWPLGVFPSILLLPFVGIFRIFTDTLFLQGYLQFFITIFNFYLAYRLAKKYNFAKIDSLYLATAFIFGSVYSAIAFVPYSWYFSQSITILLSLLALNEFKNKNRLWLMGILIGFILATRLTAALIAVYFVLQVCTPLFQNSFKKIKFSKLKTILKKLLLLLTPTILIFTLLLLYNYIRFSNPFDSGYGSALTSPEFQILMRERYGLFQPTNIITNFYWYFLKPLDVITEVDTYHLQPPYIMPDPLGLSFFITSPIFIKIFFQKIKDNYDKVFLALTSGIILITLLSYYANGYYQYGPRYILDLMPLWYLLLLYSFKETKLKFKHYLIIYVSSIFNLLMIAQLFSGKLSI